MNRAEATNKYCVLLGFEEPNLHRKRCSGYCFVEHPKEIILSETPELKNAPEGTYISINYIFDQKNKILHSLIVKDIGKTISTEMESKIRDAFFRNLKIDYFGNFLNPIVRNARGDRTNIDWHIIIEISDGELIIR